MRTYRIIILCLLCFVPVLKAQFLFTGNIREDVKQIQTLQEPAKQQLLPSESVKRKPMIAGLLSLVLPGAGQFYNENYLATGIFAAVEAGVISAAVIYNNKGDKKTTEFENVAKAHWDVVRYVKWINKFKNKNISYIDDPNLQPWEKVNWVELNGVEDGIDGFSHKLAGYGEQQYFEMIGKYDQFTAGWDQFDPNESDNTRKPQQYLDYATMRGEANDFYNVASKAVIGIYINHLVSSVQAIWETINYNRDIKISSDVKTINAYGVLDYQTNVYVTYYF